ncbi:ABC transporter permease [Microbispora sp. H11081]|uniref:ABC transporter permease n=1 Tax=Microbispora sp. H11081 TaxID=2729107 RepID=UPI001B8CF437|nr:ABC transporter permease [Microbispora sp. H11081]
MTVPQTRRRLRGGRIPLLVLGAIAVVLGGFVMAVFGSVLAPHDPYADSLQSTLLSPSSTYWLGTDDAGRDVLSRVMVGARLAVLGPVVVVIVSALVGTLFGLLAGYHGGVVDSVVMRITDLLSSLPALLVAVVLTGALGGGYAVAVAVTCLLTIAVDMRVVRGAALEVRQKAYVAAAMTLGLGRWRVMFVHILPNVVGLVVANIFLNLAHVLVVLAALSFLGLGIPPGAADWGRMLSENIALLQSQPLAAIAPGAALVLFAVSMNLVGDWVFDTISNRERS